MFKGSNPFCVHHNGALAQLGERHAGSVKVAGSTPAGSTIINISIKDYMRPNVRPVEMRARCKFCGSKPEYYTTTFGSMYHTPNGWGGQTVGSSNRFKYDWYSRKRRDKKEYPLGKLMRWNSLKGAIRTSSKYFKKNKDNFGGYRLLLSCHCGETTWMFEMSFDQDILNRQLLVWFDDKYPKRRFLEDANIETY